MYSGAQIVNPHAFKEQLHELNYNAYVQFLLPLRPQTLFISKVILVGTFSLRPHPTPSGRLSQARFFCHSLHSISSRSKSSISGSYGCHMFDGCLIFTVPQTVIYSEKRLLINTEPIVFYGKVAPSWTVINTSYMLCLCNV